jgi:hypothetical protein
MSTKDQELEIVKRPSPWINWSSFLFAVLQAACAAVLAVSGLRLVIGLGALAAAAGTDKAPGGFHQDAIRIPMMLLALIGSLFNLYMLWRVRSLRQKPAAQWRVQPLTPKEKRSERLQFVLSILTLLILASEWVAHLYMHHPRPHA